MTTARTGKGNSSALVSLLLISALVFGGVFYWRFGSQKPTQTKTETDTAAGTPTAPTTPYPLPTRSVKYNISQSKHVGPTFNSVTFDPLGVNKGQDLTITASVTNPNPVTEISGTLQSDSTTSNIKLVRISGDEKSGEWRVKIKMNDTTLKTYLLTLNAMSSNGTSTIKVTPR